MFGLYLHIPFCLKKCAYCDFNSRAPRPGEVDSYLSALQKEIATVPALAGRSLSSLYIGGGTPTILTVEQFRRLFAALHSVFHWNDGMEITVEANPGTVDLSFLRQLRSLGVNRLSLGIQSFRDSLLRRMGRIHSGADGRAAIEAARKAGFENLGADLIYALPGQAPADWEEDLAELLGYRPEHLSLYALSVEPGTPFARAEKEGKLLLPAEEEEVEMFRRAVEITGERGYEHYEISNFALPGCFSRHNSRYWTMEEYYGAGAGAHSFLWREDPVRFHNEPDPAAYVGRIGRGESPVAGREVLEKKTLLSEAMMLGLRRTAGVDMEKFHGKYGVEPAEYFAEDLVRAFREEWIEEIGGVLRLTPKGALFSNEVFVCLF